MTGLPKPDFSADTMLEKTIRSDSKILFILEKGPRRVGIILKKVLIQA